MTAQIIEVTEAAARQIRNFMQLGGHEDAFIRLTLTPEASLKDKYQLEFVAGDACDSDDIVSRVDDLSFVFDRRSANLLPGTVMDYVEGMWSSGFRFQPPDRAALIADQRAERVQRLLETEVNPIIAQHGGRVTLIDMQEGKVYLEFGGGCQGCGLAPVTVRSLVEQTIRKAMPDITAVIDVTDHSTGENPYYA